MWYGTREMEAFVRRHVIGLHGKAFAVGLLAGLFFTASTQAEEPPCVICATQVVVNSALASCFLDEYQQLARDANGAVAVDLSGCATDRGIVPGLKMPGTQTKEPDVSFMVTKRQLGCLKAKLEQPDLVLDPSVTIDLGSCE